MASTSGPTREIRTPSCATRYRRTSQRPPKSPFRDPPSRHRLVADGLRRTRHQGRCAGEFPLVREPPACGTGSARFGLVCGLLNVICPIRWALVETNISTVALERLTDALSLDAVRDQIEGVEFRVKEILENAKPEKDSAEFGRKPSLVAGPAIAGLASRRWWRHGDGLGRQRLDTM
jgi:hypothetical protein